MELFVPGPAGRLEAIWWDVAGDEPARVAAVLCHPHPLFGGTMHNTLVFRAARALRSCGVATLRFNFRGAGASAGAHDGNGAEEDDAAAALDWVAARLPGVELWGAGFSFGARTMGALAARDARIRRVILMALPIKRFDCPGIDRLRQPGYLLFGGRDEYGTREEFRARHPDLPPQLELDEVPEATHLYKGCTPRLEERVLAYAQRALGLGANPAPVTAGPRVRAARTKGMP
jgi:alpha/beta superfamily hydrolase